MGVQGLWELLAPVGRRVSVDSLGNKKLAIDASIWIIQFMKAMRDENGDMIRNAHLLGFFRRICKLLFLRIKPVFVFDGGTPVLKRRTLIARRKQRENAQFKIRKTAEKLLLNHIRTRKLEEIASRISTGDKQKSADQLVNQDTAVPQSAVGAEMLQGSGEKGADEGSQSLPFGEKSEQEAVDALLAASLAAGYEHNMEADNSLAEEIFEVNNEENEVEEIVLPSTVKGLDPALLASLPASMQLELLVQMREQLVAENRQKFQKASKVPASFSQLQIQAYLKTVAFRREITEVQRAAGGGGVGGVPTTRIASTSDREFIFSNSFQGEKPAPRMIEEERRARHATNGTKKDVLVSFPGSKSKLFSAVQETQQSPLQEVPEEGVVSLVSTEINEKPVAGSVHTYVDEKGHVRVSRIRGMGVRMTRDLQWNLYLMKDSEARRSSETGTSDLPVIPSDQVLPAPVVSDDFISGAGKQGLQISFVDDGDLSKDGDLFEELVSVKGKEELSSILQSSSSPGNNVGDLTGFNDEDEDDFEWEEGFIAKSRNSSLHVDSTGCVGVLEVSPSTLIRREENDRKVLVTSKGDREMQETDDREHGGYEGSVVFAAVKNEDSVEATKLSLMMKDEGGSTVENVILEDGPSSGESEVEWEDGTGAVTTTDLDAGTSDRDVSSIESGPCEEAQIQEAIRRSLEEYHSPATKVSSRLLIKDLSDGSPSFASRIESTACLSPIRRADEEAEEIFLARERTRKGKGLLGQEEDLLPQCQPNISQVTSAQMDDCARNSIFRQAHAVDELEAVGRNENSSNDWEQVARTTSTAPRYSEEEKISDPIVVSPVKGAAARDGDVLSDGMIGSSVQDLDTIPVSVDGMKLPFEGKSFEQKVPSPTDTRSLATQLTSARKEVCGSISGHLSEAGSEAELLRDAEEIDLEKEREELRRTEKQFLLEREQLAREEEELQAELQAEREEIQAGLDKERDLLAREEMELRATQKRNERNAETVTGEMFSDVQELLRMFGLPYVVAPMEAEAQCAFLDATKLVDGVVTEDSDVFLFGGRNVYKNLFDDRKYVETYYMKDLESEMGMNREKLVRMALLLGSDYTEGISGIGIVNAIEVVNAFEEEDGLRKFRMWLDSPDMSIFNKVRGRVKGQNNGTVVAKVVSSENEQSEQTEVPEGGDVDQIVGNSFTHRQRIFIDEHRVVSKNWNIPDSFPSPAVIAAYISPMVDKSKETFSFGRPDLEALRRFCYEKFGWSKDKADELLLPVLKEFDRHETQTRLDSFYHFSQRFAKIRSRRIQRAVTGITGHRSEELMELPDHLLISSASVENKKRSNKTSPEESTDTNDRSDAGLTRAGRGRRGRGRAKAEMQIRMGGAEGEENIRNGKAQGTGKVKAGGNGKTGTRSVGRGRGKSRSRARGSESASETDADHSYVSKIGGSTRGYEDGVKFLKRKSNQISPVIRRSTRRSTQVSYAENSPENADGACSDGEIRAPEVAEDSRDELERKRSERESNIQSSDNVSQADHGGNDNPALPGASRTYDSDRDGIFFGVADTGKEEFGFRKEQASYLAHGGGFCVQEDEAFPTAPVMSSLEGIEKQSGFMPGGAVCCPEVEEDAVAKLSETPSDSNREDDTLYLSGLTYESHPMAKRLPFTPAGFMHGDPILERDTRFDPNDVLAVLRAHILAVAYENMRVAQAKYLKFGNRRRPDKEFPVKDMVWLKTPTISSLQILW
ncbi:hypothetical protein R1flu_013119 [Riccia fluitans]|uniref:DNA repair protein UVH3 n=1 Tax=Riccia fluitans TaxID=41844 RepID=A0ABD1ZFY3_9MARC